jgi:hypothetical protein
MPQVDSNKQLFSNYRRGRAHDESVLLLNERLADAKDAFPCVGTGTGSREYYVWAFGSIIELPYSDFLWIA